jgi:putative copper resistance protein D
VLDPLVIIRALHFAACTVAMGTVAFALLAASAAGRAGLSDYARIERRFRGLAGAALAAAVLSGAVWLVLIARNILNVPLAEVFDDGGLASATMETRFGRVACLRLALAAAAMALLLWARTGWPALAAVTALMATIVFTGHAGAGTGVTGLIHAASDVVHLAAAGFWLGALPALAWLLLWSRQVPALAAVAAIVTRRFSSLALLAVIALAASGIVNTAILVGWQSDPLATTYARALVLKVALFAAMVALAAVNRFRLTPALPAPGAFGALVCTIFAETLLGLGVLLLAGLLGTQPPAAHVHTSSAAMNRDAAFVHIHTSEVMADLIIAPGRAGVTTATVQLWHEDYRPYAADRVRLTLEPKAAGVLRVVRDAVQAADGTWIVDNLRIRSGGDWIARITIERGGETLVLDAPLVLAQCSNEC